MARTRGTAPGGRATALETPAPSAEATRASAIVLGPQRLQPTLIHAVRSLVEGGRIATVTAGWEEREDEDQELVAHLATDVVNLRLHERAEDVFHRDREFFTAQRAHYDRLRRLRDLYRLRLDHALEAARELLATHHEDEELLAEERAEALATVRQLDSHHLERTREFQRAFDEEHGTAERGAVAAHRREIDAILSGCACLCIAGGHVAVLVNRLRLFGIEPWARRMPLVAWSAGAMALSERIVLFHDSPPWGRVNAEVMEAGLGVFPRLVPLPHAKRRLRTDDRVRVALFSQRFGPELCVALDEGSRLDRVGDAWLGSGGARELLPDGTLKEVGRWS
jgi:hypothetical protein